MNQSENRGRLAIVDDDLLSREVLSLLAAEAGFTVELYDSGENALAVLAEPMAQCPDVVLADMQMPGITGDPLARKLQPMCAAHTVLLAMSGSEVSPDRIRSFHGFLRKPFSIADLCATIDRTATDRQAAAPVDPDVILDRAIYEAFSQSLPAEQVQRLYRMCLDDAEQRISTMREAAAAGNFDAYHRSAHAIKGGCGMVGAIELASIAERMESSRAEDIGNVAPLDQFLTASRRIRRMLDAQQKL